MLQQQGDVLFFSVDKVPSGLKKCQPKIPGRVVFAEGEATGHHHSVLDATGVELFEDETGTLWATVPQEVEVEHQEHNKVKLAPGNYRIGIVREVDPFSEEVNSVRD